MKKINLKNQDITQWQEKDGYEISYEISKNKKLIFFNFSQDLSQELKVIINLTEPESEVEVKGIFIGKKDQTFPWSLTIHHLASNTQANVLIKGVLGERSTTNFRGLIKIDKNCKNVESFLAHHTLLLDPKAKVRIIPSLEIESNQVKASHASTQHYINQEQLFYLNNRSIKHLEAKKLIIEGFLDEARFKV